MGNGCGQEQGKRQKAKINMKLKMKMEMNNWKKYPSSKCSMWKRKTLNIIKEENKFNKIFPSLPLPYIMVVNVWKDSIYLTSPMPPCMYTFTVYCVFKYKAIRHNRFKSSVLPHTYACPPWPSRLRPSRSYIGLNWTGRRTETLINIIFVMELERQNILLLLLLLVQQYEENILILPKSC